MSEKEPLLFDTDVLIDYLRGEKAAVQLLEDRLEPLLISAITVAELFAGVREGKERASLDRFLLAFQVVPLDVDIAHQGGLYRRDYGKSHGCGLADALIGATAMQRNARLVSLNRRHFPMLSDVWVPYRKG
ncbi:MAG TPA: type II toxin-antitoxin system VapC family toxin [Thermoanaerobaculia bacterium]